MTETEQIGDATERDIAAAARDLAAAVGNPAAEQAVLDLAAAFGNLSLTKVIPTLKYTLEAVAKQREDVYLARMNELATARKDEIGEILHIVKGLQGGQTTLQGEFRKVAEALSQVEEQVKELTEELGRSRRHRAQLQAAVDDLQASRMPADERQRLIDKLYELDRRVGDLEAVIDGLLVPPTPLAESGANSDEQ